MRAGLCTKGQRVCTFVQGCRRGATAALEPVLCRSRKSRALPLRSVPLPLLLPAVLGGVFFVVSLYGDIVRSNPVVATLMSAAICGAAALSGWRFLPSAIVCGVLLVAAVPLPAAQVSPGAGQLRSRRRKTMSEAPIRSRSRTDQ